MTAPNTIDPGTIACEPGTMAGAIYTVFAAELGGEITQIEEGMKRLAYTIAKGIVDNIVASIYDTKFLQVSGGVVVGGTGGGGGAPVGAEYLVGTGDGTLTAERVVTDTASVVWDLATPGQVKATVPAATITAKGIAELATDGEVAAGVVVQGDDSRLANARTPTAHAASHEYLGSDPINVNNLSGVLADPQTPIPAAEIDTTAIHSSVAGEFAGIAAKATPVGTDHLLIEDSAAGNAKKRITIADLPGGGGAPATAEYLLGAADGALSAGRVVTDTSTVTWDLGVATQAKANVPAATTATLGVVELASDGEGGVGVVVQGNDSRLSDARAPLAHVSSHQNGGSDEINVAGLSGVLSDAQPPIPTAGVDTVALHSTTAGEVAALSLKASPTTSDHLLIEDAAAGDAKKRITIGTLPAAVPAAHAVSHQSGGGDAIKIDDLQPGDDNTDLDSSLAAHGLLRKLTGSTTTFLRGDGAWATPPGGSGLTHPQVMARAWMF